MYIFLAILTIIAALVLILVVLVQNSKGGGLSSNFSSSNQIMGAPKTADFLEKLTWGLAIVIIVLSLASSKLDHHKNQAVLDQSIVPANTTGTPDFESPQQQPTGIPAPSAPASNGQTQNLPAEAPAQ